MAAGGALLTAPPGALVGGAAGALTSEKGKRGRGALKGALIGGAVGGTLGAGTMGLTAKYINSKPEMRNRILKSMRDKRGGGDLHSFRKIKTSADLMAQSDFKQPKSPQQPQIQQSWRGRPPKIPMTQTPTSAFAQASQRTEPATT